MTKTLTLPVLQVSDSKLGFFRHGRVAGRHILTNDAGQWHFLDDADFRAFLAGELTPSHGEYEALVDKGFLRDGLNAEALATRLRRKKAFVGQGPHLHIVITTLRCNQSCQYCHASRTDMDQVSTDMSMETAKRVVDMAMQTTSPYVNFEFQGGEPTVNFPVLKFIVEYSREKNKAEKKLLEHSVVTNMTHMTEEKAAWLMDNGVMVCTSLDGPADVHDHNRRWKDGASAFEDVVRWMKHFNEGYIERGKDPRLWHVDALMTTTRRTLERGKELVDLYVDMGLKTIHLRPLNPYGFAVGTWKAIGYTSEEYLDFYAQTLDYILELNRQGVEIAEGTAATFLVKMLTADDPNFVDVRSPCGAGTGQVAYNYDGSVFTCDEGRMVAAMGSDLFQIGDTSQGTLAEAIRHPTVKALALASLQDSLPGCHSCWNKPFCGVCPMHDYMGSGDIFGQRPRSPKCKEHYTIASLLFERLANDPDGWIEKTFRRWTLSRPRNEAASCSA
ncbi:MAG: His-Xaa-Ser system radical SAM maturase HxsB [Deltaproteobacteria bacterium]|nr:His-Xaa-Ser system radical SAM maturase HxsB [Deltaproteobacteria bacterium]